MKIISLNTWGGTIYEPLKKFIENNSKNTDVFCFQEIRNGEVSNQPECEKEETELFTKIKEILSDFTGYFSKQVEGVGTATFIKNNLSIENVDSFEVLSAEDISHIKRPDGSSYYPRIMQKISIQNTKLTIYNFHGIPGNKKQDTKERDLQTSRLLEIISKDSNSKILVGDFNLDLNTEAINKIGKVMRNLIKEGDFKTTRNHHYSLYKELPFADFAFVSNDIEVLKFNVLEDEVSDHLALSLEIK